MKRFERTLTTDKLFDDAVKAVETIAQEKGFRVLHTHDVAATLEPSHEPLLGAPNPLLGTAETLREAKVVEGSNARDLATHRSSGGGRRRRRVRSRSLPDHAQLTVYELLVIGA